MLESNIFSTCRDLTVNHSVDYVAKELIDCFEHSEVIGVRERAAYRLGDLGLVSEKIIATLLNCLEDYQGGYWDDDNTREVSVTVLADLGVIDNKVIDALLHYLENDPDFGVRRKVALALGKLGVSNDKVIKSLLNSLSNDADGLRYDLIKALNSLGVIDDEIWEILINHLNTDPSNFVRSAVAKALSQLETNNDKSIDALQNSFKSDPDESVRSHAAYALIELGVFDDKTIDTLLNCLNFEKRDHKTAQTEALYLIDKIGIMDEKLIKILTTYIEKSQFSHSDTKHLKILGRLIGKSSELTNVLINRLFESNLSWGEITLLGNINVINKKVIEALLKQLEKDEDLFENWCIANTLGKFGILNEKILEIWLCCIEPEIMDTFMLEETINIFIDIGIKYINKIKSENQMSDFEIKLVKDKIDLMLRELIKKSTPKNKFVNEILWRLMWQLPVDMKNEYLQNFRNLTKN